MPGLVSLTTSCAYPPSVRNRTAIVPALVAVKACATRLTTIFSQVVSSMTTGTTEGASMINRRPARSQYSRNSAATLVVTAPRSTARGPASAIASSASRGSGRASSTWSSLTVLRRAASSTSRVPGASAGAGPSSRSWSGPSSNVSGARRFLSKAADRAHREVDGGVFLAHEIDMRANRVRLGRQRGALEIAAEAGQPPGANELAALCEVVRRAGERSHVGALRRVVNQCQQLRRITNIVVD